MIFYQNVNTKIKNYRVVSFFEIWKRNLALFFSPRANGASTAYVQLSQRVK